MRIWIAAAIAAAATVASAQVVVQFTEREIDVMRQYYAPPKAEAESKGKGKGKKDKELPPGLQKKVERDGQLPPGLQKRLDRGDPLPPGLAKRALPADLAQRLPKLPAGYARYLVGPDVVLVDTRRDLVVDIVFNVIL